MSFSAAYAFRQNLQIPNHRKIAGVKTRQGLCISISDSSIELTRLFSSDKENLLNDILWNVRDGGDGYHFDGVLLEIML